MLRAKRLRQGRGALCRPARASAKQDVPALNIQLADRQVQNLKADA